MKNEEICPTLGQAECRGETEMQTNGFKLAPSSMYLDKASIGAIYFHCGDGAAIDLNECSEGELWIGSIKDDDGKEVYGLHIMTAEYPEEGSTTLVEFSAPETPAFDEAAERVKFEAVASEICMRVTGTWVPARYADGTYRNQSSQMLWESYLAGAKSRTEVK